MFLYADFKIKAIQKYFKRFLFILKSLQEQLKFCKQTHTFKNHNGIKHI